jgi:hypothetical protein
MLTYPTWLPRPRENWRRNSDTLREETAGSLGFDFNERVTAFATLAFDETQLAMERGLASDLHASIPTFVAWRRPGSLSSAMAPFRWTPR